MARTVSSTCAWGLNHSSRMPWTSSGENVRRGPGADDYLARTDDPNRATFEDFFGHISTLVVDDGRRLGSGIVKGLHGGRIGIEARIQPTIPFGTVSCLRNPNPPRGAQIYRVRLVLSGTAGTQAGRRSQWRAMPELQIPAILGEQAGVRKVRVSRDALVLLQGMGVGRKARRPWDAQACPYPSLEQGQKYRGMSAPPQVKQERRPRCERTSPPLAHISFTESH